MTALSIDVLDSPVVVVNNNPSRVQITLSNDSHAMMWVYLGLTTTDFSGGAIPLFPDGGQLIFNDWTGPISAMCNWKNSPQNLAVLEE